MQNEVRVGDVVFWEKVPPDALVQVVGGADDLGLPAAYAIRSGDGGKWVYDPDEVGRVIWSTAQATWRWTSALDAGVIPPSGECTIIALNLTGQETAADLQRLAEVYEVREALLAVPCVACGGSTVCWGYSDVEPEHLPMCDGCCYHTGEDGWCTHVRNDLMALSERLHRDGWKRGDKVLREREPNDVPGDSAARLLAGAG